MELSGWGRYPRTDAVLQRPRSRGEVLAQLGARAGSEGLIPRGLGRSYGDSALAPTVLDTRRLDFLQAFDESSGVLSCDAGVSLGQIIDTFLPRGWFPAVVPGTAAVTVGGAIASDVHGKNHHRAGSFCDHVEALDLATVDEGVVRCSPERDPELFRATCGGMGLTGVILGARLKMQRVPGPWVCETVLRAPHLRDVLELFDGNDEAPYSVAWIDCNARGARLGRSVLRLGKPVARAAPAPAPRRRPGVPFDLPRATLNRWSVSAFNRVYYALAGRARIRELPLRPWFFPLDAIARWNRIYGRDGFLQYQLLLPRDGGEAGLETILQRISASPYGSFLAVLKRFGPGNANYLSFPSEGYTLALDFRRVAGLEPFLAELDRVVLDHGGRLYLAKDARMSAETFRRGYPQWQDFLRVRRRVGADRVIHSLQSRRLEL